MQNAAVPEIVELVERIDAGAQRHGALRAVAIGDVRLDPLTWLDVGQAQQGHGLRTCQLDRLPAHAFGEDERQDAHADQI